MKQAQERQSCPQPLHEEVVTLSTNCAGANGQLANLAVCYGCEAPDVDSVGDFRDALARVVADYAGRAGLLLVIEPTSTPTPRAREALLPIFRDELSRMRAAAFVVSANGFAGAVQRSVLAGALIALRKGTSLRVFGTVDEACVWLGERLGLGQGAISLAASVNAFCARHRDSMIVPSK